MSSAARVTNPISRRAFAELQYQKNVDIFTVASSSSNSFPQRVESAQSAPIGTAGGSVGELKSPVRNPAIRASWQSFSECEVFAGQEVAFADGAVAHRANQAGRCVPDVDQAQASRRDGLDLSLEEEADIVGRRQPVVARA